MAEFKIRNEEGSRGGSGSGGSGGKPKEGFVAQAKKFWNGLSEGGGEGSGRGKGNGGRGKGKGGGSGSKGGGSKGKGGGWKGKGNPGAQHGGGGAKATASGTQGVGSNGVGTAHGSALKPARQDDPMEIEAKPGSDANTSPKAPASGSPAVGNAGISAASAMAVAHELSEVAPHNRDLATRWVQDERLAQQLAEEFQREADAVARVGLPSQGRPKERLLCAGPSGGATP